MKVSVNKFYKEEVHYCVNFYETDLNVCCISWWPKFFWLSVDIECYQV